MRSGSEHDTVTYFIDRALLRSGSKHGTLTYFIDRALLRSGSKHDTVTYFIDRALSRSALLNLKPKTYQGTLNMYEKISDVTNLLFRSILSITFEIHLRKVEDLHPVRRVILN